jgi:multidrug transporter EmrE-like cation transporter
VLCAAVLHALWNALVAGAQDTHVTAAVALVAGSLLFAVPAALTWDVSGAAWPYIVASAALELVYFSLLAASYARADYTFAYPIARGVAPVLVLIVSVAFLGAPVSAVAAVGVLAVTGGVLLVRGVGGGGDRTALALALGVGACIAGYTLVDAHGVKHADAIPYFEAVLVLCTIPYVAAVWRSRGGAALRAAVDRRSLPAGGAMVGAYVLVLAALQRAEAAPVAASRVFGAVVVVAGIAAIALG